MSQAPEPYVTLEDYVFAEVQRDGKREWLDGAIIDLVGHTVEQARVATKVSTALSGVVGRGRTVFASDLMLYVRETKLVTFADATVIRGTPKGERFVRDGVVWAELAMNPCAIVEVLTPANEIYDRGEKFAHYMRISSLEEYILVGSEEMWIEVHRRPKGRGHWTVDVAGSGDEITILGHALRVDDLYEL